MGKSNTFTNMFSTQTGIKKYSLFIKATCQHRENFGTVYSRYMTLLLQIYV